jgi:hypothetical protein
MTPQGVEVVSMSRKGRVKWLAKGDAVSQAFFIDALFGFAANPEISSESF